MEYIGETSVEQRPKWSWWDLFLVILILVVTLAFVALFRNSIRSLVLASGIEREHLQTVLLFITTFLQASIITSSVLIITRRKGATLIDLGLKTDKLLKNIFSGLYGGFAVGIFVWGIGIIIALLTGPPPPQDVEKMFTGIKTAADLLLPFIAVVILAPVSEELYFRAMVYPVLRKSFGRLWAILLSGIFFGVVHFDLFRLVPIAAGGAVLAHLYEKHDSLIVPIIAHATWNFMMLSGYYFVVV